VLGFGSGNVAVLVALRMTTALVRLTVCARTAGTTVPIDLGSIRQAEPVIDVCIKNTTLERKRRGQV
jgi:hypothetical protein